MRDRYLDDIRHLARDKRTKQIAGARQHSAPDANTGGEEALVIGVGPGVCHVRTPSGDRVCRTKKGVVVGDIVRADEHRVLAALPRRTELARTDPHNPNHQRALAANVDVVVIVASVHAPPLRTGLIDRYLIAAQNGDMAPVVVVNKIDLLQEQSELDELRVYDGTGVPVVLCSVKQARGLDELRTVLAGKTCVFTGHSGVGKSSLVNALLPGLELRTGAVELKGKHTTTTATLHELPNGTRVIDTPGIREFGLFGVEPRDLRHFFPEFEEIALHCNFNDCTHTHEPVCAVRDANLPRYPTYVRLYESLTQSA
ncbi:MAG TPA: ribosome small subunit-dependent GTPase A [Bryobacteraceae bacterium]|nr:ribosome small subunit-dependent GTPase A [Bryobacteraceae bacterium]